MLNNETIPIIKVKYYFGVWNIQYLLLCLIDSVHRFKQSEIRRILHQMQIGVGLPARTRSCNVLFGVDLRKSVDVKNPVDSETH